MGITEAVKSVFSKYATVSGRACRSEYWYFILFYMIVYFLLMMVGAIIPFLIIFPAVFVLVMVIPNITVAVRRLHDRERSGWWLLVGIIPIIGTIVLLYWFVTRGSDGPNDFGDDPLSADSSG